MPIVTAETLGNGNFTGADHGATVSLIFDNSDAGDGPRLHRHPYDETDGPAAPGRRRLVEPSGQVGKALGMDHPHTTAVAGRSELRRAHHVWRSSACRT